MRGAQLVASRSTTTRAEPLEQLSSPTWPKVELDAEGRDRPVGKRLAEDELEPEEVETRRLTVWPRSSLSWESS